MNAPLRARFIAATGESELMEHDLVSIDTRLDLLTKAGALIIAEMERLHRRKEHE